MKDLLLSDCNIQSLKKAETDFLLFTRPIIIFPIVLGQSTRGSWPIFSLIVPDLISRETKFELCQVLNSLYVRYMDIYIPFSQ